VPSNSALLLQFLILTAVRKGQVIDVKWKDLDLEDGIWICSHHKNEKKLRKDYYVVPLSRQAIAVIERMRDGHQRLGIEIKPDGYIFPSRAGSRKGHADQASVNNFMRLTLKRKDTTLHGFRTAEGADLSDREVLGAVHAAIAA
jgi:integrase